MDGDSNQFRTQVFSNTFSTLFRDKCNLSGNEPPLLPGALKCRSYTLLAWQNTLNDANRMNIGPMALGYKIQQYSQISSPTLKQDKVALSCDQLILVLWPNIA